MSENIFIQKVETLALSEASVSLVKNPARTFTDLNYTSNGARLSLRAAYQAILSWPRPEIESVNANFENKNEIEPVQPV